MLEDDLTVKQIVELRTRCVELAIERDAYHTIEAAERYYNFIVKNTSNSQLLEAASEFFNKTKEFSTN